MCRSDRCEDAGNAPPTDVTLDVTQGVTSSPREGTRGARLWAQMNEGRGLNPAHVVMLEEACRMADRLDRLHDMLEHPGRAWLNFETSEDGDVTVTVDRLLSETRMQETAFKGLVDSLTRAMEDGAGAGAPPAAPPKPTAGGGNVVGLRSRIAEKRAQTAG